MSSDSLFGGGRSESASISVPIGRMAPAFPSITTGAGTTLRSGGDVAQRLSPSHTPGDDYFVPWFQLSNPFVDISLAPQIGQLQQESLGITRDLLGTTQSALDRLTPVPATADILGSRDPTVDPLLTNPFLQARIQPLVQAESRARREASRRGVSGPLAELAVNPIRSAISQERARAEVDTLQAQQLLREFQQELARDITGESRQLLATELALLGIGQQTINQIIDSMLPTTTAGGRSEERTEGGILNAFDFIVPIGGGGRREG